MPTILGEHFLLKHLPEADLVRLGKFAKTRRFGPKEPVFMKGDPASGMMAVLAGRVRISSFSSEGREVVLNVIGPGEVFGEIALIDGGERTANAVAMESTELMVLERRDFLPFLERNPELCIKLLMVMCHRLRRTSEQLEDFSFLDLRTRLAKRLLDLANDHGVEEDGGVRISLNLSQRILGAMMGTSREAVNKQLRAWEEEGLIRLKRGSVTLLDPEQLELIVEAMG
ncbi:MAG: Crp/Fnr family transcriptional regulator [Rhodospirillales bacterium]|jgi:CRP/FNR family transcriptional regulator, cyclic AMP receptor protein|nr:Crp/Fnr family transcriptional regulator [Rhodospirillales bacterium]